MTSLSEYVETLVCKFNEAAYQGLDIDIDDCGILISDSQESFLIERLDTQSPYTGQMETYFSYTAMETV